MDDNTEQSTNTNNQFIFDMSGMEHEGGPTRHVTAENDWISLLTLGSLSSESLQVIQHSRSPPNSFANRSTLEPTMEGQVSTTLDRKSAAKGPKHHPLLSSSSVTACVQTVDGQVDPKAARKCDRRKNRSNQETDEPKFTTFLASSMVWYCHR